MMRTPTASLPTWIATFCTIGALACGSKAATPSSKPKAASKTGSEYGADAGTAAMPVLPFEPVRPAVYVAKVKNVLLGLPPTDDEVAAVTADPAALKDLISGWMKRPEYTQKMQRFFELAFQQTQVSAVDFADQAYPRQIALNGTTTPMLVQNAQQSFARTVLQLVAEGRPFSEALTTRRFMLTTALRELYAFLDVYEVDDAGKVTDRFKAANPGLMITVEAAQGPIPIAQTLDPQSPNYMHWYDPDVPMAGAQAPDCMQDPMVFPPSAIGLHFLLYGSIDGHKVGTTSCKQFGGTADATQFSPDDFSDWQMVTLREPAAGESVTPFYDLPALRAANELVLSIPRVGFFSTPAFFANWQTNISNQMRVTLNQTLIVALGSSVDGTDRTTSPVMPPPGLDQAHAGSADCLFCHQTLDPLRSILAATYSWNYHSQLEKKYSGEKGLFAFRGVTANVATVGDFADQLAQHPLFAQAWTQKLCYYVNSSICPETDPEVKRIADAFQGSGYDWSTLVTELLASPITTHAEVTATAKSEGEVVAVSRRDHLCAALEARLGLADVCALQATTAKAKRATVPTIAGGLPSDGYGRGSTAPVLPNDPSLFFRAGTENICESVAGSVIDVPAAKQVQGVKQWSSANPDAAIGDFVAIMMGLVPSDGRAAQAQTILRAHFDGARQQGASASNALKSTFIVACLSPSFVSIGL